MLNTINNDENDLLENSSNVDDKFPTNGLKSILQNSELLELLLKPLSMLKEEDSAYIKSNTINNNNNTSYNNNNNNNNQNSNNNFFDCDDFKKSLDDFDFFDLKSNKILNSENDNSSKIYGNALLGSNIWDKNDAFQGEKFGPKFEYLEIDQFLNENGLNESDVEFLDQLQKTDANGNGKLSTNSAQLSSILTLSTSNSNSSSMSSSTTSPSSSSSSSSSSSNSSSSSSASNMNMNQSSVNSSSLTQTSPHFLNTISQTIRTSEQPPVNFTNNNNNNNNNNNISKNNSIKSKESSLNENLISSTSNVSSPRNSTNSRLNSFEWSVNDDDNENDDDLDEMDDYNDSIRNLSNDELKMQPSIKKSKKQFVPNELKDDKYWARRRKNNMAAKRSRDARRMKENQIAITASYLERENDLLRKQLEDSKRETKLLKAKLARYESMIPMDSNK